jgi:hypothetical protein
MIEVSLFCGFSPKRRCSGAVCRRKIIGGRCFVSSDSSSWLQDFVCYRILLCMLTHSVYSHYISVRFWGVNNLSVKLNVIADSRSTNRPKGNTHYIYRNKDYCSSLRDLQYECRLNFSVLELSAQ